MASNICPRCGSIGKNHGHGCLVGIAQLGLFAGGLLLMALFGFYGVLFGLFAWLVAVLSAFLPTEWRCRERGCRARWS